MHIYIHIYISLPPTQPLDHSTFNVTFRWGPSLGQQLFTMAIKPKPVMLPKRPTESPLWQRVRHGKSEKKWPKLDKSLQGCNMQYYTSWWFQPL